MLFSNFVHLHTHSHYSFLDSMSKIPELVERAKKSKMPALALTDHGNLHAAIEFYNTAIKGGVKPIIGCEVYVTPGDRKDHSGGRKNNAYHLVLLSRTFKGYQNLVKLVSLSNMEGFYYVPRIDLELLTQYGSGLICLSGCLAGQIPQLILEDRVSEALSHAMELRDIFGKENFYLELQRHHIQKEDSINQTLIQFSQKHNLPLVATNDCHFNGKEDFFAHEVLTCLQMGCTLNDPKRFRMYNDNYYFKTPEEMTRIFEDIPKAIVNTIKISDRCNVEIPLGKLILPVFKSPEKGDFSSEDYLEKVCRDNIPRRYKDWNSGLEERFNYELGVINSKGYADYFLIVWDFIRAGREMGVPVGPGRGSAAGSILAYLMGITNIDPIRYDLLFERFLNPERTSMPDIDIDFSDQGREKVIQYVIGKYGAENVASITTFGQMKARSVLRDVGRVYGVPLKTVDYVAKLVPALPGKNVTIGMALEEVQEFKLLHQSQPEIRKLIEVGQKLEGLNRQTGVHAAGIIINDRPVSETVPIYIDKDGKTVTQFEKDTCEKVGLLKMDFLGLKNLSTIELACKYVLKNRGIKLDPDEIPVDDPKTFEMLQKGHSLGVFQLESEGMIDLLVRLKPNVFEDLIAILALYRPGPIQSGMVDRFIDCKHGNEPITYPHPDLSELLKETYGIFLYQEQVMRTANILAGYTLGESDELRKAMGKKNFDLMEAHRVKFTQGAVKNAINARVADEIYGVMAKFAEYGFNKSHSAAYAMVTFQTAYLKTHYPIEYMAAFLSGEVNNTDKLAIGLQECKRMGIPILPVDINLSEKEFSVEGENIRYALSGVKGLGDSAVDNILLVRRSAGVFENLENIFRRVDLRVCNSRVLETLAKSGGLDRFKLNRAQLLQMIPAGIAMGNSSKKDRDRGQMSFFDLSTDQSEAFGYSLEVPNCPEVRIGELAKFEKETYGYYLTVSPIDEFKAVLKFLTRPMSDLSVMEVGDPGVFGGMLISCREITTKQKKIMAFIRLKDAGSEREFSVQAVVYETVKPLLKVGEFVLLRGKSEMYKEQKSFRILEVDSLKTLLENGRFQYHLRVEPENLSRLPQLKGELVNWEGSSELFFWIKQGNYQVSIRAGEENRINFCNEAIEYLENEFGVGSLRVQVMNREY